MRTHEMDVHSGMREGLDLQEEAAINEQEPKKLSLKDRVLYAPRAVWDNLIH